MSEQKPKTATEHRQKVEAQRKHDAEYWRTVLSTYEGRTVIWRILEMCGCFQDCPSRELAGMAGFLEKRRVGLRVTAEIYTHHATAYRLMEDEERERQTATPSTKGDEYGNG